MQKNGSASAIESRIDSLKESVRNLVDASSERADQMKSRAIDLKDSVVDNGEVALQKAGSFIKEHPLAAIGGAFVIGYIAVRLIK